jgi:hypothetical protein
MIQRSVPTEASVILANIKAQSAIPPVSERLPNLESRAELVQVKAEEEGEVTADRRLGEPCMSCALSRYYQLLGI